MGNDTEKILTETPLSIKLRGMKTNPIVKYRCSALLLVLAQKDFEVTVVGEKNRREPPYGKST